MDKTEQFKSQDVPNEIMAECECKTHIVFVTGYKEEGYIDIGILSYRHTTPILIRIKRLWDVLIHGTYYSDQIVFNPKTAIKFGEHLQKLGKSMIND